MKHILIKFEGGDTRIEGESRDDRHPGWLEAESWIHDMVQPTSRTVSNAGGHTTERGQHADMMFMKEPDSASPSLWLACSQGDTFRTVTIAFYRASGRESVKYLEIVLHHAIVSYVASRVNAAGIPREVISFRYASVKWTYTAQAIGGETHGNYPQSWSLAKNKATEAV